MQYVWAAVAFAFVWLFLAVAGFAVWKVARRLDHAARDPDDSLTHGL